MLELLFLFLLVFNYFILFSLSKRDFVLMRKNISPVEIFDIGTLSLLAAFVVGRFFYIINYLKLSLFFPLNFFHIYKFQGFSFFGFFIGGALALFFLFRSSKALSRVYDIFAISFFSVLIIPFVFFKYSFFPMSISLFFIFTIPILFYVFLYSHNKYILKDGSISLIILIIISLHTFTIEFAAKGNIIILLSFLQWIAIFTFLVSLIVLFLNQKIFIQK